MALGSGIPAGTTNLENSWGYLRLKSHFLKNLYLFGIIISGAFQYDI